jgi:hypothetical protein
MLGIRAAKEMLQRPDDPNIFFQEVDWPTGCAGRDGQRFSAFINGQLKEIRHDSLMR